MRGSGTVHIARAALESVAFQSDDVLDAMQQDTRHSGIGFQELRVDDGGSTNDAMMSFQADILGIPVVRPRITGTTALGAAYLVGLAVGFWVDQDELKSLWQVGRRLELAMSADERQIRLHTWRRTVERSRNWIETD